MTRIENRKADRAIGRIIGTFLDDDYCRYFERQFLANQERKREAIARKRRRAEKLAGSLLTTGA